MMYDNVFEDGLDMDGADDLIKLPNIKGIHYELINENIRDQIENPFENQINFLDEYVTEVRKELENNEENPDVVSAIKNDEWNFCIEIMQLISDKFNLDFDVDESDEIGLDRLIGITQSAYNFFVVNYAKNLKKFFIKFIKQNYKDIGKVLSEYKNNQDVTTSSLKSKINDEDKVVILAQLHSAIDYIISLELPGLDIMSYYNQDKYDIYILTEAMTDGIIGEDFGPQFMAPITETNNDDYFDSVYLGIQSGLIEKFMK